MKNILIAACIILSMSACNKDKEDEVNPSTECKEIVEIYTANEDYIIVFADGTSRIVSTYYYIGDLYCE
jgi:hypothetical protein